MTDEEMRELARRADAGDEEAFVLLEEARAEAGRPSARVSWLTAKLGIDVRTAAQVAARMRRVDADPYASVPEDAMEEIAEILGSGNLDRFDREDGPGSIYVAWTDFDRPTLFYDFSRQRWRITTPGDEIERLMERGLL